MSDVNKDVNDDEFENAELARQEQLSRERVGDDKVDQRLEQLANLTMDETMQLKEKAEAVNAEIANTLSLAVDSDEMQTVVQHYLAYTTFALSTLQKKSVLISKEKFIAMANSIANDADQKANFEQFSTGFSKIFSDAMLHYAKKNLK